METFENVGAEFSSVEIDKIDITYLKFVFDQGEKRLKDTLETFESTKTRSLQLLSILIILTSTCGGYFFVNNDFGGHFDSKQTVAIIIAFAYFICFLVLIENIKPSDYFPFGSSTKKLLVNNIVKDSLNPEKMIKDMYYSEVVNLEFRIRQNNQINKVKLSNLGLILQVSSILPIAGLILYIGIEQMKFILCLFSKHHWY